MDRVQVFPGQVPLETDLLNTNRNILIALGKLNGALFGVNGIVHGLAVSASSPPALSVAVGPGEIYQRAMVDATAYSSLPADTVDYIVKQGLLLEANTPVTLSCPAPTTAGQSINYLIEAAFAENDVQPVTLPYYDASNPTVAWSGPDNSGATNFTTRAGQISLVAKAGVAATTGSQTTPAADAGFIPLAVVTVASGQTSITAGNITAVNSGRTGTDLLHTIQQNAANYAVDSGVANASVVTLTPAPAELIDGLPVFFRVAASNTGAATLNVNGTGVFPIVGPTGGAIVSGELTGGSIASVVWNAPLTSWQLQGYASGSTSGGVTTGTYGSSTSVAVIGVNAEGVITSASSVAIAFPVTSVFGRTGSVSLQSGDITSALGFTPLGAPIAAHTLLGNPGGSASAPTPITLLDGLAFEGSSLGMGAITPDSISTAAGSFSGTLTVNGAADFTSTFQANGAATFLSSINVTGAGICVGTGSISAVPAAPLDVYTTFGRLLFVDNSAATANQISSVNVGNSAFVPLSIVASATTVTGGVLAANNGLSASSATITGALSVQGTINASGGTVNFGSTSGTYRTMTYLGVLTSGGSVNPTASGGAASLAFSTSGSFGGGIGLIDGTFNWGLWDTSGALNFGSGTNNGALTSRMTLSASGALAVSAGITTTTGTFSGAITATTGNFTASDERLKTNIANVEARPLHRSIPYVAYDRKEGGTKGRGTLAQSVEALEPLYIARNEDTGMLAVDYSMLAFEQSTWASNQIDVILDRLSAASI